MRRTRIEKRRRSVRVRPYPEDTHAWSEVLDPRDPDIVRAKQLRRAPQEDRGRTP